jgi:ssDNA-binding Zn-finger/Zn-ribbon topoisomerase 1
MISQNESGVKCELCWADGIIREAKKWANLWNKFYGCTRFPECRWVKNVERME